MPLTCTDIEIIATNISRSPWHSGLTGKLTWTQIGAMSRAYAQRGQAADKRQANARSR